LIIGRQAAANLTLDAGEILNRKKLIPFWEKANPYGGTDGPRSKGRTARAGRDHRYPRPDGGTENPTAGPIPAKDTIAISSQFAYRTYISTADRDVQ
jgi:hypothetical protein